MTEQMSFREIVQRLPTATCADAAPADLWPQICSAHHHRQQQRRRVRFSAGGLVVAAGFAMAIFVPFRSIPAIDWQARAQALEMQIDTLPLPAVENAGARQTVAEIARLDGALQAAYDRDAGKNTFVPLWKRRSELLDSLLAVRQKPTDPTSI